MKECRSFRILENQNQMGINKEFVLQKKHMSHKGLCFALSTFFLFSPIQSVLAECPKTDLSMENYQPKAEEKFAFHFSIPKGFKKTVEKAFGGQVQAARPGFAIFEMSLPGKNLYQLRVQQNDLGRSIPPQGELPAYKMGTGLSVEGKEEMATKVGDIALGSEEKSFIRRTGAHNPVYFQVFTKYKEEAYKIDIQLTIVKDNSFQTQDFSARCAADADQVVMAVIKSIKFQ
jgi:hypothetical protein